MMAKARSETPKSTGTVWSRRRKIYGVTPSPSLRERAGVRVSPPPFALRQLQAPHLPSSLSLSEGEGRGEGGKVNHPPQRLLYVRAPSPCPLPLRGRGNRTP